MNRLRELRIEHGYKTQQDLAAVLFVNQTAVSQWERGATMPSNQMLLKLSKMYGVSTDYLLGNSDEKTPLSGESKERPTPISEDEQDDKLLEQEFMRWFRVQPPDRQKEILFDLAKAVTGHGEQIPASVQE